MNPLRFPAIRSFSSGPAAAARRLVAILLVATLTGCGGGGASSPSSDPQPVAPAEAPTTPTAHVTEPLSAALGASACSNPVASAPLFSAAAFARPAASFLASERVRPFHRIAQGSSPLGLRAIGQGYDGPYGGHELRSLYGFPAAVADVSGLTPAERAAQGEGQTVYIVMAYHDPEVFGYLETYSHNYGLPSCPVTTLDASTSLPLSPAAAGCSIAVVGADAEGNISSVPRWHPEWAIEEALDIQMVHTAAPLARIVVVAGQADTFDGMAGALKLANRMGNGIVSMSWGLFDIPLMQEFDAMLQTPGMTYVAATGDTGHDPSGMWPAAVPRVLAVGGTYLRWNGVSRQESAWVGSGGGLSPARAKPVYQNGYYLASDTGCQYSSQRMLPDVSALADSVWAYFFGTRGASYYETGGTSAAAPFWAGTLAAANGLRALSGKQPLADVHTTLYQELGKTRSGYDEAFFDVSGGANGVCPTCSATGGFDLSTGLGSPNGLPLLRALAAR